MWDGNMVISEEAKLRDFQILQTIFWNANERVVQRRIFIILKLYLEIQINSTPFKNPVT